MSTHHRRSEDGMAHTEFPWPLLAAIPAAIPTAYSWGSSIYSHGSTAIGLMHQAQAVGQQVMPILNFFQGTAAAQPAAPPLTEAASHVMEAASLSAGGYFMYWVGNYAYNTFIKHNGAIARDRLVDMISYEWNRANNTTREQKHNKQFQSKLQEAANTMHKSGNSMEPPPPSTTSFFHGKNRNLFLFITATVAAFVHSSGATEMQRQTSTGNSKSDEDAISTITHWDEIDTSRKQANQLPTGGAPFISRWVKSLYDNEDYYSNAQTNIRYTAITHVNIVRTIFNILLGAYIQANRLIGLKVPSNDSDSIVEFSQWATVAMYWEVLVHLLHLHGWGPVYNALQLISEFLYAGGAAPKPSTRGKQEHINSTTTKKKNRTHHV